MANTRYERHCELWKEHDKHLGRWMIGTLLFAVILQHKVLIPFTEIPRQRAGLEARLGEVQKDLPQSELEREGLQQSESRLAEIKEVVRNAPWTAERENLRRALGELQQAYEIVRALPRELIARMNEALETTSDRLEPPPAAPGQLPPRTGTGTHAGSYPDVRQIPKLPTHLRMPPGPRLVPANNGIPNVGQFPPSPDLPFVSTPADAPFHFLPPAPGTPANDLAAQAWAVAMLGFDLAELGALQTDGQLAALIERQKQTKSQQLADETLKRIAEMVDRLVIDPLEALPGEMPEVAQLRAAVARWEQDHLGQSAWFQTVPEKGATIGIVSSEAANQTDALLRALEGKERAVEAQLARLGNAKRERKLALAELDSQREKLEDRMQKLMPQWLQELVSADEMLQLYPLALVGLLTLVGLRAYRVRLHYVVVRSGHDTPDLCAQDPAVSSLWTLVYRGPLATLLTAGVYLGAIGMAWVSFDSGCRLLNGWLASQAETVVLGRVANPGVRIVGHLLFFAAAGLVVWALVVDRGAMRKRAGAPA